MKDILDKNNLKPIKLYNNNLVSEKQMIISKQFQDAIWKLPVMQYFNKTWTSINIWANNNWRAFGIYTMWIIYR